MSIRVTAEFGKTVTTHGVAVAAFDIAKWDIDYFDSAATATFTTGLPAVVEAQVRSN